MRIKNKIINFLTIQGKKTVSEKIFYKSIKILQKKSTKSIKDLLKFAIIKTAVPFKIYTFKQKKRKKKKIKEVPFFIKSYKNQTAFAIKNLVNSVHNQKQKSNFSENLQKEFLLAATTTLSNSVKTKINIQNFIKNKNYLLKHYKW